jgi:hypothetical protein
MAVGADGDGEVPLGEQGVVDAVLIRRGSVVMTLAADLGEDDAVFTGTGKIPCGVALPTELAVTVRTLVREVHGSADRERIDEE